jgi:hypothetical protein
VSYRYRCAIVSQRARGAECVPAGLMVAALLLGVSNAKASPNYPAIIDQQLGVSCPRPLTRCLICHVTAAGGEGTAKQPFAMTLKNDYGLSGGKAGRELVKALEALPDDLDTDGDGTPDLEELKNCGNPSGPDLSEGPGYGCTLQPAPAEREGVDGLFAVLAASPLVGAYFGRRRSARRS